MVIPQGKFPKFLVLVWPHFCKYVLTVCNFLCLFYLGRVCTRQSQTHTSTQTHTHTHTNLRKYALNFFSCVCVSVFSISALCVQGKYTNTDRRRYKNVNKIQNSHKCARTAFLVSVFISSGWMCAQDKYTHTHASLGRTQVRRIFWTLPLSCINIKHESNH